MTDTTPPPRGLLSPRTALFLDFDGTLASLQDDADAVRLPEGGAAFLSSLAGRLGGAVAFVTGRDVTDIAARVPQDLWRAGNHGSIVAAPGEDAGALDRPAPPGALSGRIETLIARHGRPGVYLERKGRVLAVHTRAAPETEAPLADALGALARDTDGFVFQHGNAVLEIKPEGANKGAAITALMDRPAFAGRTPLFLGDDTTDEDGFAACHHLDGDAIKVGAGPTCAHYRLPDPDAVWRWLKDAADDL